MTGSRHESGFERDVAIVQAIEVVPTILDTLCRLTGMGFAAVARVTADRWIACGVNDEISFGLQPGGELKVETTICHEIRSTNKAVVIDDVDADPVYAQHHTPRIYGLKSYISVPITLADGTFFGTLCAIDTRPHRISGPEVVNTFVMFANLIGLHLDAHERWNRSEASLLDERQASDLREQFIAVLGHDLRNPLSAMLSGVTLLGKQPQSPKSLSVLGMMRTSAERMAALIDNVLDFARGRLGGGLTLETHQVAIEPLVRQVVNELQLSHPEHEITLRCDAAPQLDCDPVRIAQLLSNLLGNAVTHGAPTKPISVCCDSSDSLFQLSVANAGRPIPDDAVARLFQPFERGASGAAREGLGLGLYIASQIAEAHGGMLSVTSTPDETCFTFQMPVRA